MCGCKDCKGITLLKGNGIISTVDNEDGTFTITYSDGSTFTTSDLTGPQGIQGPQGVQGDAGTNGTNAFKYVSQHIGVNFETDIITIPYATWTTCDFLPDGCGAPLNNFVDLHVQVWFNQTFPAPATDVWYLGTVGVSGTISSIEIDVATGSITIALSGNNSGRLRVVILG